MTVESVQSPTVVPFLPIASGRERAALADVLTILARLPGASRHRVLGAAGVVVGDPFVEGFQLLLIAQTTRREASD